MALEINDIKVKIWITILLIFITLSIIELFWLKPPIKISVIPIVVIIILIICIFGSIISKNYFNHFLAASIEFGILCAVGLVYLIDQIIYPNFLIIAGMVALISFIIFILIIYFKEKKNPDNNSKSSHLPRLIKQHR